ncbi:hypothetical protein G4B88_002843 [Cannabis sativa]|uniref:Uncharacterized protein n=1 Tax=Cannabis sativa TaxID=3483 RepID=A0A7J6ED43_CANSA|nr:hypothetical protein G4B88_002843 [Cannabis sativa]
MQSSGKTLNNAMRSMHFSKAFLIVLAHGFSSASTHSGGKLSRFPDLPKVHSKYKHRVIQEAQNAFIDYLHTTRSLPFTFAEHIARNSIFSLCNLIKKIDSFYVSTFSRSFSKLLRYQPINEFEFFFESIGIDHEDVPRFLPEKFLFSEDVSVLNVSFALSGFGFPWNTLGRLYKEKVSIFSQDSAQVIARLRGFKEYGFCNLSVVGICLAFPHLLSLEGHSGCDDIDSLFDDLKRVYVELNMGSFVEGNVDGWYEVCCKVKVFYDLGCEKGKVGEWICRKKELFLNCPNDLLLRKVDYFCEFGVRKDYVGWFLLKNPKVLSLDLETPVISVLRLLEHFGLNTKKLQEVSQNYNHVLGRNKMANLPQVMRALDLHEWFFNKIMYTNSRLLVTYSIGFPDQDIDEEFNKALKEIESSRLHAHTASKLDFLKGIGFGENASTIKVLNHSHGTSSELQERFDCLLGAGISYSKLCLMINISPKILSQSPEILEKKVNFLCQEIDSSLEILDSFPRYFNFHLENRIKRRHNFFLWLRENGLCAKNYSISSMVATSERNFIARLSGDISENRVNDDTRTP